MKKRVMINIYEVVIIHIITSNKCDINKNLESIIISLNLGRIWCCSFTQEMFTLIILKLVKKYLGLQYWRKN